MRKPVRTYALAATATAVLAASVIAPAMVFAAPTAANQTDAKATTNPSLQVSENGFNVMRDIRAARIAIFDGNTDLAEKLVTQAKTDLSTARADIAALVKKGSDKAPGNWIAIDGQLLVSDDFVATPEKAASIKKSNDAIKKGDAKTAVETLKDAAVDVGFTRVLMPISQTAAHIKTALSEMSDQRYYQANLALKAAEDSLNVDTVMLYDTPQQPAVGSKASKQTSSKADTATKTDASKDAGTSGS